MCAPKLGGLAVADDYLTKNRNMFIIAAIVAVAAIGAIAYYAGRHNAVQQQGGLAPGVAGRAAQARVVRLPPKKFGNWTLACVVTPQDVKRCTLIFQAIDQTRTRLLMRLSVLRGAKGPVMVVLTPPNAILAGGVTLTPGTAAPVKIPFVRCMPRACQAGIPISDSVATAMGAAQTTEARFIAGTGRPVTYKLPTQGFQEGYAAWQQAEPPAPAQANIDASKPRTTAPSTDNPTDNGH
jgi:invasion protein IalB